MKNDEPLKTDIARKYQIIGNGTSLRIRNIGFADTGAYMCQATSIGKLEFINCDELLYSVLDISLSPHGYESKLTYGIAQ